MKVFVLGKFHSSPRTLVFHSCMFHGEAERQGIEFPSDPSHFTGEDLSDPLFLSVKAFKLPPVFWPEGSLIVGKNVRDELSHLPGVEFLEVVFKKTVWFPYEAGDFSYYRKPEFQRDPQREDPEKLIARLPDMPEKRALVGRYFEVILPWDSWIALAYEDTHPVPFTMAKPRHPDKVFHESFQLRLSERLMMEHGMIRAPKGIVLSEQAFEILSPKLDRDYFCLAEAAV
jgi:hypothetical protein